ncbi:MAG: hypothetical protein ACUVR0_09110 [Candidatus Aminicenantales bacterium]
MVKFLAAMVYKRQTSTAAADFLHHLEMKFPFRIKAIQIDDASEFMDQFEQACRRAKSSSSLTLPTDPRSKAAWSGVTGPTRRSSTKSRIFRSIADNIISSWLNMNTTITIYGLIGP